MHLFPNHLMHKRTLWITTGIVVKFLLYGLFLYLRAVNYNYSPLTSNGTFQLYVDAFDTKSYLLPVENLLARGEYIEDFSEPLSRVIRMPGYGAIYLVFRMAADAETAKNLLVLLQLIASGMATYCLALIGYRLTGKPVVFYVTFFLYAFSTFLSMYDMFVLTESLAASAVVYSLYFILSSIKGSKDGAWEVGYGSLMGAGGLLALAVFMRPVIAFLFVPYAGFVFCTVWAALSREEKAWYPKLKRTVAPLVALGSVFVVGELAWVARNYAALGTFVPAQYNSWAQTTGEPEKDVEYHSLKWIRAVGGDCIFYEPNSLASWLFANEFCGEDYQLPATIYGSAYQKEALVRLRQHFLHYKQRFGLFSSALHIYNQGSASAVDADAKRREAIYLNDTFAAYTESYIRTHPFDYYVTNRVKLLKQFLVHSGVGIMPLKPFSTLVQEKSLGQLCLKVGWVLLYWMVLAGGFGGLVYFLRRPSPQRVLVVTCMVGSIVIFPFLVQIVDSRFLCLAYPFLTISAGAVIGTAFSGFIRLASLRTTGKNSRSLVVTQ